MIATARPTVERVGPDEPGVASEGCRIDLLRLLGNAGALHTRPLFVPFERVPLGPVRFAEDSEIGHTAGRNNAASPLLILAEQPSMTVKCSAAHANPASS